MCFDGDDPEDTSCAEMDKSLASLARDVRHGASRFSPAKRHIKKQLSGVDGGDGFKEKPKKKLRRLGVVGTLSLGSRNCEMGSDGPSELRSKGVKIPRKFSDDYLPVDHASVPRKLRSAMKKRNRESLSAPVPDSKRRNYIMSGRKIFVSGMKQEDLDQCASQSVSGPITKDEEEVVETLYALAGMFPNPDTTNNTTLDCEPSEVKPSALSDAKESPKTATQVSEDASSRLGHSTRDNQVSGSSRKEEVPQENETDNAFKPADLSRQNNMNFGYSVPHVNIQASGQCKTKLNDEKPPPETLKPGVPFGPNLDSQLKHIRHQITPFPETRPEITSEPVKVPGSQQEHQHIVNESKENGPAFWGCSSSSVVVDSETFGSSKPVIARASFRLESASCLTRPSSSVTDCSVAREPRVSLGRRSQSKRCATHVYIGHLIQHLQLPEGPKVPASNITPHEGSQKELFIARCNLSQARSSLNAFRSNSGISDSLSMVEENLSEAPPLHTKIFLDQQRASIQSGACSSQRKTYEFLSFSVGGDKVEASNSCQSSRAANGLESSSQFCIPCLQPLEQHQTLVSLPLPRTSYAPCSEKLPAAPPQLQKLPSFIGGPYCGASSLTTSATKNQQHQQLWAAQLAAQYRAGGMPASHISNWQTGRPNSSLVQCAQPILPPASSRELLGPRYMQISPHNHPQLLAAASSLATNRLKGQQHHIPSSYEVHGGGFRPEGVLPLQLLCNEHL